MIKQQPSFTTDIDPSNIENAPPTDPGSKPFEDAISIQSERSSSNSNFLIKTEPDYNPYQHYQTTIPPGTQHKKSKPSTDLVGSALFNDIQQPLESSGELAQRLDQLSKIVSHLVVNIQDNTKGLKTLTETLMQPNKIEGELIKGQKFPLSNMDDIYALDDKLREEPDFRSSLVSFSILFLQTMSYFE